MLEVARFGPVLRLRMAQRLPGLRPLWVHAFLVDGLLIDTGLPHTAGELLQVLAGERVEQVVLTHHHEDHSGAAAALSRQRGLLPLVHKAGLAPLARPLHLPYYERMYWGTPEPVVGRPLGPWLETGRHRFRVLPTAGHAEDHVALFEPEQGWLFSGDLLVHPRLTTLRRVEDVSQWMASLEWMTTLSVQQVFCSHYPKVGGLELLQAKLDFLTQTGEQAAALRRRGMPLTAIRDRVLGSEPLRTLLTGGTFSKLNLIRALLDRDGLL